MKYKKSYFILCAIMLSTISFPSTMKPTSALTYSSDTDVQFTFNSVISINLSSPNLVISDLAPGEYSDSNIITVGANTNASMGYQLSATVGQKNGTDALVNTTSSSNTFANLTTTQATLAGFSDNTWGYSYCADTSTNCGTSGSGTWVSGSKGSTTAGYAGLPLDNNTNASDRGLGGVLLLNTSGPEDTVQSVQFKIGAKASNNQASGDYTNTINFYAVANPEPQLGPVSCTASRICYNMNSLTPAEGTMRQQYASDGSTVTLLASNFSRINYGFAGWNTAYDYSGAFYGPNEDITVPTGTTANGLSLYAVWVKSAGSMQTNAISVCNGLMTAPTDGTASLSSVSALTDQRDNQTYAIAKLTDGKCWMIENLRLESSNSDNSTGALAQGYGTSSTYGNFSGLAKPESANFTGSTAANSLYSTDGSNGTINIGTSNFPAYRMPRYNNTNTSARASSPYNNTGAMYSYGNYYTWHAAIANTNSYGSGDYGTTSLCPTGWRLPMGFQSTANNSFGALSVALGGPEGGATADSSSTPTGTVMSKKFRSYPNNFLYAGSFRTSVTSDRGELGNYWTSTAASELLSYELKLGSSNVFPGNTYNDSYFGYSIRCTISVGS